MMNKLIDGVEVPLTDFEILEYLQQEQEFIDSQLSDNKKYFLSKINSDDNRIYQDTVGNKSTEYETAEKAATAFKNNNFEGTAPEEVQSWADARMWTARQATEDILRQAAEWRYIANVIRRNRLKAKEDVKRASNVQEVETAMDVWNIFVNSIRNQLGI